MFLTRALQVTNIRASHALVAQLDRVLGYEPSGRRFESSRVHHTKTPTSRRVFCACRSRIWPGRVFMQPRPLI
jgi:hypothetical protein